MSKEALKASIRDTEDDSAYEKCGFVVHVFVILFGCGYLYCVTSSSSEPPFDTRWTLYLSTVLLVLFILAPILYCLLNSLSVAPPTSLDSLYDDYTRQPPMQPPNERYSKERIGTRNDTSSDILQKRCSFHQRLDGHRIKRPSHLRR